MGARRILYTPKRTKPLSKKDFKAEVERILRNIQSQTSAFQDESREAALKRRKECEKDFELWKQTYLPHYFWKPSGEIHHTLHKICSTGNKSLNAVGYPREHGKSKVCTFAETIYKAVTLQSRYSLIISDTFELAAENVEFIKYEFENNPRLKNDYGKDGELKTEGWWKEGDIVINTDKGIARIRAFGSGQKVRGTTFLMWRPMYIIVDDLENNLNVRNKKLVQERLEWLCGAVYGSMDDDGTMVMIGTMIDKICVLKKMVDHILENQEKIEKLFGIKAMNAVVYSAIKEDGTPLWPEGKSIEKLLQIKATLPEKVWLAEFMNQPADIGIYKLDDMKGFPREFYILNRHKYLHYSGSDVSARENETNDPKAHVVIALDAEVKKRHVVDAWIRRDTPFGFILAYVDLYAEYKMIASGFETNGYQYLIKDDLEEQCREKNFFPTVWPLEHYTNKTARCSRWEGPVRRQDVVFSKGYGDIDTLILQMNQLGTKAHDDGPDALDMGMEVSMKYSGDFSYSSTDKRAFATERETTFSNQRFSAGLRNDYMGVHI